MQYLDVTEVFSDDQETQKVYELPKGLRPWQDDLFEKGVNKRN